MSIQAGDIIFLPHEAQLSSEEQNQLAKYQFPKGGMAHPFLIKYGGDDQNPAQGWLMTSLNGKSVQEYCAGNDSRKERKPYRIPVTGAPPHPDSGHLVQLSGPLDKPSYIQIDRIYQMPVSVLQAGKMHVQKMPTSSLDEVKALTDWAVANPRGQPNNRPIPAPRTQAPTIPGRISSTRPQRYSAIPPPRPKTSPLNDRDYSGFWRSKSSDSINSGFSSTTTTSTPTTTPPSSPPAQTPMGYFSLSSPMSSPFFQLPKKQQIRHSQSAPGFGASTPLSS